MRSSHHDPWVLRHRQKTKGPNENGIYSSRMLALVVYVVKIRYVTSS